MGIPYAEVIGDPIAHSKSPLIHKFWLEKLGLEGDYRSTRVSPEELRRYFEGRLTDPDWLGSNITMPLKIEAVELMDELDLLAMRAGAVNTVTPTAEGRLKGFNTDASGFANVALHETRQQLPRNHVATLFDVIGAGGAARAVAAALEGHEVYFFNRTEAKADQLSDELGIGSLYGYSGSLDDLSRSESCYDARYPDFLPNRGEHQLYSYIVVNASSMGMKGYPRVPIRLDRYPENTVVIDLVYHPVETPLVREARELGLQVVDGLTLLIAQAAGAFRIVFGHEAPREHDTELRELLTQ